MHFYLFFIETGILLFYTVLISLKNNKTERMELPKYFLAGFLLLTSLIAVFGTDASADAKINKKTDSANEIMIIKKIDASSDSLIWKTADLTNDMKNESFTADEIKPKSLKLIEEAGNLIAEASRLIRVNEFGEKTQNTLYYNPKFTDSTSDVKITYEEQEKYKESYNKLLYESISILEKAKEAYINRQYNNVKSYIDIILKIITEYKKTTGVKTLYTVTEKSKYTDCLWRISGYEFIYNDPRKWPIIWKANKDIIDNPDMILPGQVLVIPEIYYIPDN